MQPFTQKYTIVQFLEDVPDSTQFSSSNWPLHATVVDVFAIDWDVPTMAEKLTRLLNSHKQTVSTALEDAYFGPEKQTRVTLLERTEDLVGLHYALIELLEQGSLTPNNPQFIREGFLPHATVQQHARLNKGDTVIFNALSIIDMFPGEDPYQRRIVKTLELAK